MPATADIHAMEALLQSLGQGALLLLGIAVALAGWEHLRQQAADRNVAPQPAAQRATAPAGSATAAVDLHLDGLQVATENSTSLTVTSEALNRASGSARRAHDAAPWLDTQPRVAVGPHAPESSPQGSAAETTDTTSQHARPDAR